MSWLPAFAMRVLSIAIMHHRKRLQANRFMLEDSCCLSALQGYVLQDFCPFEQITAVLDSQNKYFTLRCSGAEAGFESMSHVNTIPHRNHNQWIQKVNSPILNYSSFGMTDLVNRLFILSAGEMTSSMLLFHPSRASHPYASSLPHL